MRSARKTYELVSFLADVLGGRPRSTRSFAGTRHLSRCLLGPARARHPGAAAQASGRVDGLTLVEMTDTDVCCGFGGTFCVKYADISNAIVGKKADSIAASGANTLLAGDLGCLMNMAGKLSAHGRAIASATSPKCWPA